MVRVPSPLRGPGRVPWVSDADATHCMDCKLKFTVMLRKHHCRACGEIFCNPCSPDVMPVGGYSSPQRICKACASDFVNASSSAL